MVKIVRFPLGSRAYYEFKIRQNETWHRPAMITASSNSQILFMSSTSSHTHQQNIAYTYNLIKLMAVINKPEILAKDIHL